VAQPEQLRTFVGQHRDVLQLIPAAKAARRDMGKLRRGIGELEALHAAGRLDDPTFKADTKKLKDAEKGIIAAFNKAYLAAVRSPVEAN
jgi:hypothetical protein